MAKEAKASGRAVGQIVPTLWAQLVQEPGRGFSAATRVAGLGQALLNGEIVATLSQQSVNDHDRGPREKNLRRVVQSAEVLPDEKTVVSVIRQLAPEYGGALAKGAAPRMTQFAERFPGDWIVVTLSRQSSWTRFIPCGSMSGSYPSDLRSLSASCRPYLAVGEEW